MSTLILFLILLSYLAAIALTVHWSVYLAVKRIFEPHEDLY